MKSRFGYEIICAPVLAVLLLVQTNAQSNTQKGVQKGAQPGVLKGKVKERNGKALEGVIVRATSVKSDENRRQTKSNNESNDGSDEDSRETKSNDKGEFEFADLPAGQYSFSFEKQGYKTFITRKLEITPGETTKLSSVVELLREGDPYSVVRGAVFHGPGYTLPNATVVIERIDGARKFKQETISREGGEFSFRLKAEKAKYRITATARGFQPASLEVEVETDEARNVALTLQQIK